MIIVCLLKKDLKLFKTIFLITIRLTGIIISGIEGLIISVYSG